MLGLRLERPRAGPADKLGGTHTGLGASAPDCDCLSGGLQACLPAGLAQKKPLPHPARISRALVVIQPRQAGEASETGPTDKLQGTGSASVAFFCFRLSHGCQPWVRGAP